LRISKHISYKEATQSQTATRLGIPNAPGEYEIQNMQLLAEKVFEPLREFFDVPIYVSSFYRSKELNKAIGGSSRSQHCEGRAIDLDDVYGGVTNAEMFQFIANILDYDQLIWELGNDENPAWVHVSYVSEDQNRKQMLRATKKNGKTIYEPL
jgi:zinc D-Ala-D-Ala carboxypeptidase